MKYTEKELELLNSPKGIKNLLKSKKLNVEKTLRFLKYERELRELQIELIKLQYWVKERKKKVAILFEGRDAAGKGGAIRRFVERMNPRLLRIVALPKPNQDEKGEWYFQRYTNVIPSPGEIVFFDRSWYNRAVVEPVNKFCTQVEYKRFMKQVPDYENMLIEDGVSLIKLWFSISKDEQDLRFRAIKNNALKRWKMSPLDEKAQGLWDKYTHYKDEMFRLTHSDNNPWIIIKANRKTAARLEAIKYVLSTFDYPKKRKQLLKPNQDIIFKYEEGLVY